MKAFSATLIMDIFKNTMVSPKFCNILVNDSLWHIYHMTETVQAEGGTCCGW